MASDDERDGRPLLIIVLVLLVVVQPVWSRLVNELWDAVLGPRTVAPLSTPNPAAATPLSPPPAAAAPEPADARAPVSSPAAAAPAPAPEPPAAEAPAALPVATPSAAAAPEVLGASVVGEQIRVLVDLHGEDDPLPLLDDICTQAQAFVALPLSGRPVRLLAQRDTETVDHGIVRCP